VPLGAFLSGGVDSSAVVAVMAGMSSAPVRTCAIGFEDPSFNESQFAQSVATRYRTDHHLEVISGEDYGLIDRLAWLYDEPYADSSAIPTYRVCQLARRHVTVALSGDGGDESCGGYRRYRLHIKEQQLRDALPAAVRGPVFGALGAVYPKLDWLPRMFRAKTTLQALGMDAVGAYAHSMAVLREDERLRMYSPAFLKDLGGYRVGAVFDRYAAAAGTDDPLALIQYVDYKTWLTGDINTKVDRASMAHSLEVREPLMDHKLVEWLATLPSSLKLRGQEGKWLFKKALEPMLPNDVLYRPKMGFSVPLARWLRGPLKARLEAACRGERLADTGRFDMDRLSGMVDEHLAGSRDFSAPLWSVLMFDAFLANAGKPEAPAESAMGQVP
jgi:asparagine synthase (glutamine-hydrolysing)